MGAGCGDGGSELLTNVLTLYLRLTIAYYPHCQAKYCPLSPHEDFTRIIKPATARTGQTYLCSDAHHKNGVTFLARPSK